MADREHRPTDISAEVRKRLRDLRNERGYRSAAHLASACRAHGATWVTDNVIENLESDSRNRSVTVDELFALAEVLWVSPLSLLPGAPSRASQAATLLDLERRVASLEAMLVVRERHAS